MPYQRDGQPEQNCPVCGYPANVHGALTQSAVDCSRCGDFVITRIALDDCTPVRDERVRGLASHLIKRLQGRQRPQVDSDFFDRLPNHSLPSPSALSDNLLLLIDERVNGRPGLPISIDQYNDLPLQAAIGAVDAEDTLWAARNLADQQLIKGNWTGHFSNGHVTAAGWARIEELKRARISSKYAFFARKFANADLDQVYARCLQPAVKQTGYELRTVTQKAGHIDAIIEDEIRRCRFLIADLSDDNAGAYWEAGFAEGLGKPVIYVSRAGVNTHFDTNHRHTVRWDLDSLDETAAQLKAVIRNTLLGDANQEDT